MIRQADYGLAFEGWKDVMHITMEFYKRQPAGILWLKVCYQCHYQNQRLMQ